MMRTISKALMCVLLLTGATALRASQQDEQQDKLKAIQTKLAALKEQGRTEAIPQLEREAGEIREALRQRGSPQPEIEREIAHLKERLQELLVKQRKQGEPSKLERVQAERRELIARIERERAAMMKGLDGGGGLRPEFEARARSIEESARRLHHVRVAAENLKAAGALDLAGKLTLQAETMEREIGAAKEQLAREMDRAGGPDPRDAEIRELRQQNELLKARIREMRTFLEKSIKPGPGQD